MIFIITIYYQIKLHNYLLHMYLIYICDNNYELFFLLLYTLRIFFVIILHFF